MTHHRPAANIAKKFKGTNLFPDALRGYVRTR